VCQPVPCQRVPCTAHVTLAVPGPSSHPARGQQGGVAAGGCSKASQCQPCHCCLLPSSLPAPGDRQRPAGTCAPRSPCSPISSQGRFLFRPPAEIPGSGSREAVGKGGGTGQGARCLGRAVPAQPCRPAETVTELNRRYREQNLPVTDGSRELHSLCAQLEFLLQVPPLLRPRCSRPHFPLGRS